MASISSPVTSPAVPQQEGPFSEPVSKSSRSLRFALSLGGAFLAATAVLATIFAFPPAAMILAPVFEFAASVFSFAGVYAGLIGFITTVSLLTTAAAATVGLTINGLGRLFEKAVDSESGSLLAVLPHNHTSRSNDQQQTPGGSARDRVYYSPVTGTPPAPGSAPHSANPSLLASAL